MLSPANETQLFALAESLDGIDERCIQLPQHVIRAAARWSSRYDEMSEQLLDWAYRTDDAKYWAAINNLMLTDNDGYTYRRIGAIGYAGILIEESGPCDVTYVWTPPF